MPDCRQRSNAPPKGNPRGDLNSSTSCLETFYPLIQSKMRDMDVERAPELSRMTQHPPDPRPCPPLTTAERGRLESAPISKPRHHRPIAGQGGRPIQKGSDQMAPRHVKTSTMARPIGTLTVGLLLALGVGTLLQHNQPAEVFDQEQLVSGVAFVLSGTPPFGYGLTDATGVACPAGVAIAAGTVFRCSVQIAGSNKFVAVMVTGDSQTAESGGQASGAYEVASPS